jgi:tetratricopeptide (TPR) repeat protein
MKQLLSYIVPYINFIKNALLNYNGRITNLGTQIMWGAVFFLGIILFFLHRGYKNKAKKIDQNSTSLGRRAARLSRIGDFINSAKIYERSGALQPAADAYYKAGTIYYAAQLYKRLGMKDKQASALEQIGFHKEAGELYRELSMYKQAGENLLKAGELLKAANML